MSSSKMTNLGNQLIGGSAGLVRQLPQLSLSLSLPLSCPSALQLIILLRINLLSPPVFPSSARNGISKIPNLLFYYFINFIVIDIYSFYI